MKRTTFTIVLLGAMSFAATSPASAGPDPQQRSSKQTSKPHRGPAKITRKAGQDTGRQEGPIHFWLSGRGWHNFHSDTERKRTKMVRGEKEAMRKASAGSGSKEQKMPVHFTRTSHRGWHIMFTSHVYGGDAR